MRGSEGFLSGASEVCDENAIDERGRSETGGLIRLSPLHGTCYK